jgi:hypothetical protein
LATALAVLGTTVACLGSITPAIPTISQNSVATIVAGTIQALTPPTIPTSVPASAIPPTAVPPTFPPLAPTPILPIATRIEFQTGTTTGVVVGTVQPGQTQFYVLTAMQGQPMIVLVDSLDHDVILSLKTQGGTFLLNPASHQTTWEGLLPTTEDYYVGISGGASTETFTLSVQIPARIKFAVGKDTAIVSGKTVSGYNVAYVLFALQNQKMSVALNGTGGNAALTIYGFSDGQPYLRAVSEETTFSMILPSSQDYIFEVVPKSGKAVAYTLVFKIK